jgi:hypothetical protein
VNKKEFLEKIPKFMDTPFPFLNIFFINISVDVFDDFVEL